MTSPPIKAESPELAPEGAPASAQRLYIYYRIAEADLAAVLAAVHDLQQTLLAAQPGLRAELLRRPGLQDGQITLLEIYAHAHGMHEPLAQWIERRAAATLAPWLQGPRHVERFESLAGGRQ